MKAEVCEHCKRRKARTLARVLRCFKVSTGRRHETMRREPHWTTQGCVVYVGNDVTIRVERDIGEDWSISSWKQEDYKSTNRVWTRDELEKLVAYMSLEGMLRPGETVSVD